MKKKYLYTAIMLFAILVAGMGLTGWYVSQTQEQTDGQELTVVTSFYPMYIAAENVIGDADGVRLENLSEPQTGCLHDFQLTPEDMKLLSTADVFIINGGGIESFMKEVAEAYPNLKIIEACENISLLSGEEDDTHHHEGETEEEHAHGDVNAHAWMSVSAYETQVQTIADGLSGADPERSSAYQNGAKAYLEKLDGLRKRQEKLKQEISGQSVILFHEAYAYVAEDYGLQVNYLLDLDEERQVSAGEVSDVLSAVRKGHVKYILAEELYGKSMGDTIRKESDAKVLYLDPLNRGTYEKDSYINGMKKTWRYLRRHFMRKIISPCGFHCIKVNHLGVWFSEQEILKDVNLHMHCGSLNAIIGKNGAGKSTLIRAMLGDIPHTGDIEFRDTKDGRMQNLKIGYVPQSINIEKNTPVSVYDLLASYESRYPVFLPKNRKLYEKIKAHLRIFEAEELIDKQVCNLSGGQLQRVLLALAVMDEPNLLLLDEPVSGIDQNGMELFFKTMDYLKKHYDLAIILISHDLDYVARYADHVVLLDKTVLRQGTVKEVYESSEFERIFSAGKEETWIKEDETND